MASKDLINSVDINNPSNTRRTSDLLPAYHRTEKNTKFLASTLDQLVQTPQIKRVNGFVGSKLSLNYDPLKDQYIESNTKLRNDYRFEPALVLTDVNKAIKAAFGYDDLINELSFNGANVSNLDRLFRPQSYSYDPMIDWDKFVNFGQYFWLPVGPDAISISGAQKNTVSTFGVRDSDDGYSLIFTPDGGTTNPVITLYRGMTYVFNVKSEFPFYVKTAYVSGAESLYSNTTNNGAKNGQVIVSVDDFTPNNLFYYAEGSPTAIGKFVIKQIEENTSLNVETEILGKETYTSGNGVKFSNGMKINFVGNVIPEFYQDKEFIIEGVGTSIKLIDFQSLQITGTETTELSSNFDATLFDEYPFDDFKYIPLTPEYISINRAAVDNNPWSRYNRWVHQDVITETAKANGVVPVYPADKRAQRPIIEFRAGMQLFNFGAFGKANVDLIDNTITNTFKTVENSSGLYIDGVLVEAGNRVIFNADLDPLVRGKVFEVKFVEINNRLKIDLEEVLDSQPTLNESVLVNKGNTTAGTCWWFDGYSWKYAQQKTKLNQFPLFELFDESGNKFADQRYYKSSFSGTTIFEYKLGTVYDSVLGLNLSYRNVANVGEYLFNNTFMTDTFTNFRNNSAELLYVSNGFIRINSEAGEEFRSVWTKTDDREIPIIQYQVVTEETSFIEIDSIESPGFAEDLSIEVFVNDNKKILNVDYIKSVDGSRAFISSTTAFKSNDRVLFKLYTKRLPINNGYYEVPINLTNNPLNGPVAEFSFTEISDHIKTMTESSPDFVGSFPGNNNLRDLRNYSSFGTKIVSHSNPLSFAHYFLGNSINIISSIRKVSEDYNQFKSNLMKHVTDLKGLYSPAQCLDLALISMNNSKDKTFSYNYSDMLAYGKNNSTRIFTVSNPRNVRYSLASIFDSTVLSRRALLVYLNGNLLIKDHDYEIGKYEPNIVIKTTLAKNDVITVLDYPITDGGFVPPTPTKLGLYPKFKPEIFYDSTYAGDPVKVIQGHDGSITVAYNDYRDEVLLEFEKRIFNNIKVNYNPDLFNIYDVIPGAFRSPKYSLKEINEILTPDFLRWAGYFGVDYINNNTFDELNSFTFNYTGTIDPFEKRPLNGYWRGIYKYYFDTDRPHSHPWEMLGFTIKPLWWNQVYGEAPYTSGNLLLWKDIEEGRIAEPGNVRINPLFARPGLSKIIPVDESGKLISPTTSGLASTPIVNPADSKRIVMLRSEQIAAPWKIGDYAPAEAVWRRSSWFPFACQVLFALTMPASYASLMFDPSRMKKNLAGEWRYGDLEDFLTPSVMKVPNDVVDNERILASGYSVFVVEAGTFKDVNYIEKLKEDFSSIDYRLMAKLGAFASKDKLSVGIDAIDPSSPYPGVLLPSEDYQIYFSNSSPIATYGISGLIIQKNATGWTVRGYDRYNPYFTMFKPFASNVDQTIRVGGVSEKFLNWTPNTTYNSGQIIFFGERYYRVLQKHNSDVSFNSIYYQGLPYLPVVGGVGVLRRTQFDNVDTIVPYGTFYRTVQEVYDFIVGYGRWLEAKGFVFDEFNESLEQVLNWEFTAKEFLFWTTQNWGVNSVITLSPFANKLVFRSDVGVVSSIINNFKEYSLLKADGAAFPKNNFTITRLDGEFNLTTVNTQEGIFFARVNLIQKEHALVMNNFTLFNDVIYDIETGYRQRRIKLKGFFTNNWNGDFFSPGFVFDQASITDWIKFKDYKIGDVVRFSGNYYSAIKSIPGSASFDLTQWVQLNEKPEPSLLPNFDYKINQFEDFYSLDIDNFDVGQQAMAQHLIGYTPRPYLNFIIGDPIAQYKFYQGFVREKGTKSSVEKLSKASLINQGSTIDFNEEWAFRIGYYGGFNTYEELEINLENTEFVENPQIIEFVQNTPADKIETIYYKVDTSVVIKPSNFSPDEVFKTFTTSDVFKLPYAGYVRFDDINSTAYNKNSILDIANNTALTIGKTVWLGFREDGQWDVLRVTEIPTYISGVSINVPGQSLLISTFYSHQLDAGDIVSITRVATGIDQCYIVQEIVNQNQFIVLSTLTALPAINDPLVGLLFTFKSSRLENFDKLSEIPFLDRWNFEEKVWVDNDGTDNWAVYKKTDNYSGKVFSSEVAEIYNQHYGTSVATKDGSEVVIVSSPDYLLGNYYGRVFVLFRDSFGDLQYADDFSLIDGSNRPYYTTSTQTLFGQCVAYDSSTNLVVVGAPKTSKVKPTFATTNTSFIVNYNSTTNGSIVNQGVVKLSLLNTTTNRLLIEPEPVVITTTAPTEGKNFGWSIALSEPEPYVQIVKVENTNSIKVGYSVAGQYITGTPLVTKISGSNITLNVPQTINTLSEISFLVKSLATTPTENNTTINVASTSGILINSIVSGQFIQGQPRVNNVGEDYVIVDVAQTISTSTLITFTNTSTTGYTIGTRQHLFVGAPSIDATGTGSVYLFNLDVSPGNDGSISVSTGSLLSLTYPSYSTNELFGWDVSGNKTLTRVAVSAPGYTGTNKTSIGAVFVYDLDSTSTVIQKITGEVSDLGEQYALISGSVFGNKIKMSQDGEFLFIASPFAIDKEYGTKSGVVDAFKWDGTEYKHNQRFSVPLSIITSSTCFGYDISLSNNNETLAISSVGKSRAKKPTFDYYSSSTTNIRYVNDPSSEERKNKTTFDSNSTMFFSYLENAGTAHVYNKLGTGSTKWAYAQALVSNSVSNDSMFGSSVLATNDSVFVGAPAKLLDGTSGANTGTGEIFVFDKINSSVNSWALHRKQDPLVNIDSIQRIITIDSVEDQIQDYFDIVDPVKGKILGRLREDIRYITSYDPAIYSLGISGVNVDSNSNWLDEHVGDLWWDLSTVKYVWYEQGDLEYRKNNWNNVFPGSSIDVYEWVRSEYLPSDWAQLADTAEGLTNGISGQPKFNDNSVISVKQVYNSVSNAFTNVYYYWVKNRVVKPSGIKNRTNAAFEIAQQIADPVATGNKFFAVLSPSAFMLANTKPTITTEHINLNISFDTINDSANRHTEWLLLQEGDPNSRPNWLLEKKLIDSLLGHDSLGNPVPDPLLPEKLKYGIEVRPRQGLFVNRREALRNIVEFTNSVIINERLTGQVDFTNLTAVEAVPLDSDFDTQVEDIYNLELIPTKSLLGVKLQPKVNSNGEIYQVDIVNTGFGYMQAPQIEITSTTGYGAELQINLDSFGRVASIDILNPGKNYSTDISFYVRPYRVLVLTDENSSGKWAIYEWNDSKSIWTKTKTQSYNTSLYWKYVDWVDESYDSTKVLSSTVAEPFALEVLESLPVDSYVKVMNGGDGRYLILRKTTGTGGTFEPMWDIVYSERGTIQFLDSIWNPSESLYAWDQKIGFDQTQYDQSPDKEIEFILSAIKDDIFADNRKVYWNQLFFKSVRYAMSEQRSLDWAFKTTFISVNNFAGSLDQPASFKLNNAEYYESFLNEVKPYHTKIRKYTEIYTSTEWSNSFNTDFDMPVYYNTATLNFNKVEFGNPKMLTYPWKAWFNNFTLEVVSIDVFDGGDGYTQVPSVSIVPAMGDSGYGAQAVAYISLGKVSRIVVTNPGKNYTATPTVVITGGGDQTLKPARAYAQLGNSPVRANTIGLRFDRVSAKREIGNQYYTDKFVGDGSDINYELTFAPFPSKESIILRLNGRLLLIDTYTILYSKEKYITQKNNKNGVINDYTALKALLKLNFIPSEGDIIEITYPKNLDLYSAADRIEDYYFPEAGMPGKELAQLMSGVEYSGLQVIGLPFDAAGGWDATGISWAATPWDNLGIEEGYTSYSTTSTDSQVFTLPSLITTGTEVNIYVKNSKTPSVNGTRVDGSLVNSFVPTIVGLGTGAVDKVEMIIPGAGYVAEYTSINISAPNTVNGISAVISATFVDGAISIDVVNPGSGYTEPPVITIIESINPNNNGSGVTIQAYARAVLKAEFKELHSTATISSIEIPDYVFGVPPYYKINTTYTSTNVDRTILGYSLSGATTATFKTVVLDINSGTTWVVPADFSNVNCIEVWGGGAAGGDSTTGFTGGGAGGYARIYAVSLTTGTEVNFVVGKGGDGDLYYNTSTNKVISKTNIHGETSIFGSANSTSTSFIYATGGRATGIGGFGGIGSPTSGVSINLASGGSSSGEFYGAGGAAGGPAGPGGNGYNAGFVYSESTVTGYIESADVDFVWYPTIAGTGSSETINALGGNSSYGGVSGTSGFDQVRGVVSAGGGGNGGFMFGGKSLAGGNGGAVGGGAGGGLFVDEATQTYLTGNGGDGLIVITYLSQNPDAVEIVPETTFVTDVIQIPTTTFVPINEEELSNLVVFRYSTSDGTVNLTDSDSLDALISGGDLSMTTALGLSPSEIILDGGSTSTRHITGMNDDGFLNPIESYAPEECVPGQVRESLGISVYSSPIYNSPLISNKRYWVDGVQRTYQLGVRPSNSKLVFATFDKGDGNEKRLSSSNYTINYEENTFTFTSNNPGIGWLSITSMQLGSISLLDSAVRKATTSTTWNSKIGFSEVGSSYVTVNGISISSTTTSGVPNTYTISNANGGTQVKIYATGTAQIYLFRDKVDSFSDLNEVEYIATGTNTIQLTVAPGKAEPYHSQVIVSSVVGTSITRLNPPVTTYYEVEQGQNIFDISKSTVFPLGRIDLLKLEVYVNGRRVKPGRIWSLRQIDNEIKFRAGYLSKGDLVAIVIKEGQDYLIENGQLVLSTTPEEGAKFRVITFTNHDPDFIRSERFKADPGGQYIMQRDIIDSSYVWVTYAGKPLTLGVDYTLGNDRRTVSVREGIFQDPSDIVIITSFADTSKITGYRIFQDMLGRTHYKRISTGNSTVLAQDLKITDTSIVVKDSTVLTQPFPQFNKPGIILVGSERIEYFVVQGNVLTQLRRGTLGTGSKEIYFAGEQVYDQGSLQTIPTKEGIQKFTTSTTTTTNDLNEIVLINEYDLTGVIEFSTLTNYSDQVEVRYQGKVLLKPGLTTYVHNRELAHDSSDLYTTSTIDVLVPYDFTINNTTSVLTLNSSTVNLALGGRLEVIRRYAHSWYSDLSQPLANSESSAAKFIYQTSAEIPKAITTST